MPWRVAPDEFRGMRGHGLQALGIPGEQACVDAYCKRSGRDAIAEWDHYLVFNMFRMAAILQGIPMADAAWRQARAAGH